MTYPDEISRVLASIRRCDDASFDARGVDANLACGCVVRFGISIDAERKAVTSAGYKSNGCGYMLAAAEIAAEALEGLPLSDLHGDCTALLNGQFARVLSEVPCDRNGCLAAVSSAAARAFAKYRSDHISEFRGETALICTCFGVTEDAIRTAISERRALSLRQIGDTTNAGTGCGSCQMLIRELIDEHDHDSAE